MVGTIITMAFVFAILAIAAYALFEDTPVRAPTQTADHERGERQQSPHLD